MIAVPLRLCRHELDVSNPLLKSNSNLLSPQRIQSAISVIMHNIMAFILIVAQLQKATMNEVTILNGDNLARTKTQWKCATMQLVHSHLEYNAYTL